MPVNVMVGEFITAMDVGSSESIGVGCIFDRRVGYRDTELILAATFSKDSEDLDEGKVKDDPG